MIQTLDLHQYLCYAADMIDRDITAELLALSKDYPIVTITGPRQTGKTTLVKAVFPDKPYVNLEHLSVRSLAETDPERFLSRYPEGAILDEVQRVPALLSYLQVIVDEHKKNGEFILTGSEQFDFHEQVSQSLAGRTALLKLLALSFSELKSAKIAMDINEQILHGFYPRIYQEGLAPGRAYRHYFETYIERDLRRLSSIQDLNKFRKFVKLCAGRIGQLLNYESLSNEVGVSAQTINHWISILEASYIIVLLQPYYENFGKRVIKSPKLYFTDVGLAAYLLDIETAKQVDRDPLRGNLFENMAILDFMKYRYNQGLDAQIYFYRDSKQHEIDLIFKVANHLIPVEIKSSQTFDRSFLKNIQYFKGLVGERMPVAYLAYAGRETQRVKDCYLIRYNEMHCIKDADE